MTDAPAALIFADLHFRESPDGIRDEWQQEFFSHVLEHAGRLKQSYGLERPFPVLILGDLTEEKNRHPSHLVNFLVSGFKQWKDSGIVRPYLLWGNHDMDMALWQEYVSGNIQDLKALPFFAFLLTAGLADPLGKFIEENPSWNAGIYRQGYVATQRDKSLIFFHGPVRGSKISSQKTFEGTQKSDILISDLLSYAPLAIGGDIHIPQTLETSAGKILYVGSYAHTHTISLNEFLASGESSVFSLFRGYMQIVKNKEGPIWKVSRILNPHLSLLLKTDIRFEARNKELSMLVAGMREEDFWESLEKAIDAHKRHNISYKKLKLGTDVHYYVGYASPPDSPGSEEPSGVPIKSNPSRRLWDRQRVQLELKVQQFTERFSTMLMSSGCAEDVRITHRNIFRYTVFSEEVCNALKVFSMTAQERLNLLYSSVREAATDPLDEEILPTLFKQFDALYNEYAKEVTSDEAD